MSGTTAALLRITALVLLVVVLAWHLSSDDQRRRLLVAFGLAESLEQAELMGLSLVGPGFEVSLLEPLPPAPIRFRRAAPPVIPSAPRPARAAAAVPSSPGHRVAHAGDPCAAGGAANPSRRRAPAQVHHWVDDAGNPVFSDRAPAGAASQRLRLNADTGVSRFSADYGFEGFMPPMGFQQQLEIDIDGVFHFLADDLRLGAMQPVHVRLRVIDGGAAFSRAAADADLTTSSGFYRFRDNQAVVRWMGDARTRAVARHEIMHLALGNWLGRVPLWLNEGLAEVVERMRFQQSFATAAAPARELARVRQLQASGRLPPLRTFLRSDRGDWNNWGNELAYPYAWSLVYFLLEQPARQQSLNSLLAALAQHRCRTFDHVSFLEREYFGGVAALEREWRQWLRGAQAAAIQF